MMHRSAKRHSEELPQERSWWKEKLRQAKPHLAVPLFATVGTGPLIAHYFGHLSLAGFISNPVIVPLVGFIVVPLGLITGFLALILLGGGRSGVARRIFIVGNALAGKAVCTPSLANIAVPVPNALEVTTLYLFIVALFVLRRNRFAILAVIVLASVWEPMPFIGGVNDGTQRSSRNSFKRRPGTLPSWSYRARRCWLSMPEEPRWEILIPVKASSVRFYVRVRFLK
jgi:hypothetical protein